MSVSNDDIYKVAKLARIAVSNEQIPEITQGINDVLVLIDKMQTIDTANVEPLANPHDAIQRLREDVVTAKDERKALLANAPSSQSNFFLVPKVID